MTTEPNRGPSQALRTLTRGETVWRTERADRYSIIVDAADFFFAAKQAMLRARHSIVLIGWDFDARIEIEPEGRTLEGPNRIGALLDWLAKRRPDLDVRILKWDLGMLNSLARGETPFFMLSWMMGGRVRLKLDGAHPPLAAHHMKLLVIDEALAFCGGIDMTTGRWDTREHEENRPGRRSPRGKPLGPWHDATSCVSGPAAKALAELARARWERATGETMDALAGEADLWPDGLPVDFADIDIGIARTAPEYEDREQIAEIEATTFAVIRAARRTLYIESQYFASRRVAELLAERLGEPDGPEVVVINPDTADGWLEAKAMDSARIRMMRLLRDADRFDRFRILYPVNEAGSPIYVHAKIMVADDRVLKLGSANLNNRSMGYDTECDLVITARDEDEETQRGITAKRDGLIAEHLRMSLDDWRDALARHEGRLVGALDALRGGRLEPLPIRELTVDEELLAESDLADPERPVGWRDRIGSVLRRR
ncbi:phospholipase D-like domain-containing protein [Aureimonas sp. ME7]|uniref:phospholipase D-like domain-containing protein n=1 Tax=Aureimonas sp. ME7 TaxID=2744252 RepID=UPI001FCEE398|nr:phospholipase D-like domain-containing protein [Aureimonas sp. ME7]